MEQAGTLILTSIMEEISEGICRREGESFKLAHIRKEENTGKSQCTLRENLFTTLAMDLGEIVT
jgi:hypothetical protein